jgi:hypothetical protein
MKKFLLPLVLLVVSSMAFSQEIQKDLKHFNKIIASPRINLILKKGEKESVRLVYNNVSENKINIEVQGKTLAIYLDNARKIEKLKDNDFDRARWMYEGVTVTAFVTYTELESLEIRGNQELTCNDVIEAEEFRLKAYGENDITLASLKTDFFKASLYGENELKIKKGRVVEQKYKLYGENKIDTREMKSAFTSTSIFGEGNVRVNSTEKIRVDAFGEPTIYVRGGAQVNKRLVFGKTYIRED